MAREGRDPRRVPWQVKTTFVVGLVVSVALFVAGVTHSTARSADVWFEVAKAGLQLLAIVILGGAVAWAFRNLDDRREDRRRRDEYLSANADELLNAYFQVKAVRRSLRAADYGPFDPITPTRGMTQEQRGELKKQVDLLAEARATLEKLVFGIEYQPSVYYPLQSQILQLLKEADDYVGAVAEELQRLIEESEKEGSVSASAIAVVGTFLAHARTDRGLKRYLSTPVRNATLLIQSLRFERGAELSETAERVMKSGDS